MKAPAGQQTGDSHRPSGGAADLLGFLARSSRKVVRMAFSFSAGAALSLVLTCPAAASTLEPAMPRPP